MIIYRLKKILRSWTREDTPKIIEKKKVCSRPRSNSNFRMINEPPDGFMGLWSPENKNNLHTRVYAVRIALDGETNIVAGKKEGKVMARQTKIESSRRERESR